MKIDIKKAVDTTLEDLKPQQRETIVCRFALNSGKRQTLQEIADEYSLTRERIRQVQNNTLAKMRANPCIEVLTPALEWIENVLSSQGGAALESVVHEACGITDEAERNYVYLLLTLGEKFYRSRQTDDMNEYWYLDESQKKRMDDIVRDINREMEKRGRVFGEEDVRELFGDIERKYGKIEMPCDHVMRMSRKIGKNPHGEWGLKNNPEVSLSRLSGYIRLVLREANGEPLSFSEVAKRVSNMKGSPCHEGSCHNELVRQKEFILVGRGLYVLEGMGYRPGTISDIAAEIIKERGPMKMNEIIELVRKERFVKNQSIVHALLNKKVFTKDDQKRYVLVEQCER